MTSAEGTGVTGSLFDRGSSAGATAIDSGDISLSMLAGKNLIFGPPGTGKTYAIERLISEAKKGREDDEQVPLYYVTFSRSMAAKARSRIKMHKNRVGTLHSILTRAIGWTKENFINDAQVEEFCRVHGIKKNHKVREWEGEVDEADSGDEWGMFESALTKARSYVPARDVGDVIGDYTRDWGKVADSYLKLKRTLGKSDYTDILETVAANPDTLPIAEMLFVDEAQDLTQLMWRVVSQWSTKCGKVVIAGDDDQGIYGFMGASARDLLAQRQDAKIFHLSTTRRFGQEIRDVALSIIKFVQEREVKSFDAGGSEGSVSVTDSLDALIKLAGSKWILCRTKWICRQVASVLDNMGVVYVSINARHRNLSPWSWKLVGLVNILHDWPPSEYDDIQTVVGHLPAEIMVRGRKTAILNGTLQEDSSAPMLEGFSRESGAFFNSLFKSPITVSQFLEYADLGEERTRLVRQHVRDGISEDGIVHLDTCHASKGGEADNVSVIMDISKRIHQLYSEDISRDEETRILYVGSTRARKNLMFVKLGITENSIPIPVIVTTGKGQTTVPDTGGRG